MSNPQLHPIGKADIPAAADALVDSFQDDPLWRAVFEGANDPQRNRRAFFECPVRYGLKYGKAYASSPALEGIAVWVPGRVSDMSGWRMLRCGALRAAFGVGMETMRKVKVIPDTLAPDRTRHMKGRSYVYLMVIGVARAHQGKGIGSRLMRAITSECDAAGLPLYLETETEANLPFYARHGLEMLECVEIPGLNLPMWEMVREPRV